MHRGGKSSASKVLPIGVLAGFGALLVMLFGGCGSASDRPPPVPTSKELAHIATSTIQPAYWLGRRYRGLEVSFAAVDHRGVRFSYGKWYCDPGSGCSDNGSVATRKRNIELLEFSPAEEPRKCWSRIGAAIAVLDGCDPSGYPHILEIFTGNSMVAVDSLVLSGDGELSSFAVARDLKPLNEHAPWPLREPAALRCREFLRLSPVYRKSIPDSLRPINRCAR